MNGALSGTNNNGKGFRFLLKEDENTTPTYKINWGENTNAPRWLSLDESADHFAGPDTQYKNYLLYTDNGANSSTSPSEQGSNVIFDLADGEYVINFYNYASPYYTLERKGEMRDYNEVIYKGNTRNILGRKDYKFFCVWSDYIAWNKPDDVDVYTVTQFNPSGSHAATVTLTKQDISYIPAKKAVILAMKTDKNSLNGGMVYDAVKPADLDNNTGFNKVIMDMTPYATPDATVSSGVSEFKPLYESTELSRYETVGGTIMANYLFGFYHANHVVAGNTYDNADFLLGFWQTTGNGSTYPKSGFLQLTRAQADLLGVGAAYTITDGGAGAPAFLLLFDDEDATVTGIRDLDAEVPSVKDVNSLKVQILDEVERYLEVEEILGKDKQPAPQMGCNRLSTPSQMREQANKLREEWQLGIDAIGNVQDVLEAHGIKVICTEAPSGFDGVSGVINGKDYIVVLNKRQEHVERRRFTAMHELGHLLFDKHFAPDLTLREKEKLCDAFASEMLLAFKRYTRYI